MQINGKQDAYPTFAFDKALVVNAATRRSEKRVTRAAPWMTPPAGNRALRYFDVLSLSDATDFYYEMAQPDGSHDLRVYRRKEITA
jgi:hypothetical protein